MHTDDLSEAERLRALARVYFEIAAQSADKGRRQMLANLARAATRKAMAIDYAELKAERGGR